MATDRFGGEVVVTAPYPGSGTAAGVGTGSGPGGGGGIPDLGSLMGLISTLGGPMGKVLGMASSLMGGGQGPPELPNVGWDTMDPVSTGNAPMTAGLPGGGGGPTAVPTEDPMMFAGAPAGLVKGKSKVQKQTEAGSKKGENPDENKMGGWDKAAIAASVASGLLGQGGPALPSVGFTPNQPVSSNFMV